MGPFFTSEDLTAAEWSELLGLLSRVLGEEAVRALFDSIGSGEGVAALANPATYMHETGERIGRILEGRAEPSKAEMEPVVRQAFFAIRSRLAKEMSDPASLGSPDGAEFVAYLDASGARLGAPEIIASIRDQGVSMLWSLGTLHAALFLVRVAAGSIEGPFEARIREMVRGVREAGERWYKPLLQVTLRIERSVRGTPNAPIPKTLGAVMGQCQDLWKPHGPTAMLLRDTRLIRNADGHCEVEVDVPAQTVRFVNRPSDGGPPEILGPWTEDQLRTSVGDLLNRCGRMSFAYARFFFEEACRRIEATEARDGQQPPT